MNRTTPYAFAKTTLFAFCVATSWIWLSNSAGQVGFRPPSTAVYVRPFATGWTRTPMAVTGWRATQTSNVSVTASQLADSGGAGADTYRAGGGCPSSLSNSARAIRVSGGSAVPTGAPGDVILLERGNRFSFKPQSNRAYGAYTGDSGSANPIIGSIWVSELTNVRFDGLDATTIGGRPAGAITFSNGRLGGGSLAVNAISGGPMNIECNLIGSYGLGATSDNCTVWQPGSSGELVGNKLGGCGDGTGAGKHGVYAKADGVRIAWNTFGSIGGGSRHNGQSISIRYQGHVVEHNLTTDSSVPSVGYFSQHTTCVRGNCGPKNVIRSNDFASGIVITPYGGDWYNWNDFDFVENTGRGTGSAFIYGGPYGSGPHWLISGNSAPGYTYVYRRTGSCPLLTLSGNTPSAISGC